MKTNIRVNNTSHELSVDSRLTLAAACEGQHVVTIEGLAAGDELHPMQAAFLHCDGFQCGYCTPGQILSAVCAIQEVHAGVPSHVTPDVRQTVNGATLTDEEIRERLKNSVTTSKVERSFMIEKEAFEFR